MAKRKLCFIPPFLFLLKPIQYLLLLSACIAFTQLSLAQTNISGIVNSYYKVIEVIPAKACVRLASTAGLSFNDKVMIIQMKGATINTTASSSSFGDTTSLNDAGNYEIGIICYIKSDSVFFDYLLLNDYSVADKVQLVRIPEYTSAIVTDTLRAAPWNNTTGTGGVLAIFVDGDLELNASISGDSSGYRGGTYKISNGTCTNIAGATQYAYNPTSLAPQNGAWKGEGVSDIATPISGGRGSPANGGGGGNNHNNGGAGGANLSAGGDGGANSSSTGCSLALPGLGGKALSSYGGKKIFMGGGGGAGHTNNGIAASNGGGHGGGIVFIRAGNLIGNGYKISANGQMGGPAASDGASGAGAGGTIIMDINNYIGTTIIAADGGQGGTEDDGHNLHYCYGSGGGGSGGAIYFSGTIPVAPVTITTAAGNAGVESNHDGSCNAAIASSPGITGQTFSNYMFSHSSVLANTYCSLLLPVELTAFTAQYTNGSTMLQWTIVQPELVDHFIVEKSTETTGWIAIDDQQAGNTTETYRYNDLSPSPGNNYYRIKVIKKNAVIAYSVNRKIFAQGKNENINIYPNPASHTVFITGITAATGLSLFDLSGKLLWQKKIFPAQNFTAINLPSIASGIYLIKIDMVVKKLIVQ